MLFAADFEQLDAVVRADLFSEVVEELEYREGLLWCPVGRDVEVDDERQAGRGLGRRSGSPGVAEFRPVRV
jgi:activator of HSP90 ATPase